MIDRDCMRESSPAGGRRRAPQGWGRPFSEAPIPGAAIEALLTARPELMLDGARPDLLNLRLCELWLSDEEVVCVRLTGPRG